METSLQNLLQNSDFKLRLQQLHDRVTQDYFRFWQVHAPHYTDHGKNHCDAIKINLDEFIPETVKRSFNEYELFLLLSSVLLHDIGMMCSRVEGEDLDTIRKTHNERSREFISKNFIDLLNYQERIMIGEICYAHRDFVPLDEISPTKTIRHSTLGDVTIRLRFLASLLRFADACDVCHTRTSEQFVSISNISEVSKFYHELHERISGINFNQKNKSIQLSINIKSTDEEKICQEYIVNKLQDCFNTVRDVFLRNDIYYVDIIPVYYTQKFLSPLTIPQALIPPNPFDEVIRNSPQIDAEIEIARLESLARETYVKKDYPKSIEYLTDILEKKPNSLFSLNLLAQSYAYVQDIENAEKTYRQIIDINPEDTLYWTNAGHFLGEILFDFKESYKCLKRAWEINPSDLHTLNYAEALVTMGNYDDSYHLATKILEKTNEINRFSESQVLRAVTLFLKSETNEAKKELQQIIDFYRILPKIPSSDWVYSKLKKYLKNTKISKDENISLQLLFDLTEENISFEDFCKQIAYNLE